MRLSMRAKSPKLKFGDAHFRATLLMPMLGGKVSSKSSAHERLSRTRHSASRHSPDEAQICSNAGPWIAADYRRLNNAQLLAQTTLRPWRASNRIRASSPPKLERRIAAWPNHPFMRPPSGPCHPFWLPTKNGYLAKSRALGIDPPNQMPGSSASRGIRWAAISGGSPRLCDRRTRATSG